MTSNENDPKKHDLKMAQKVSVYTLEKRAISLLIRREEILSLSHFKSGTKSPFSFDRT